MSKKKEAKPASDVGAKEGSISILIYEEVPESIRIFAIDDEELSSNDREALKNINGLYMNSDELTNMQSTTFNILQLAILPLEHADHAADMANIIHDDDPEWGDSHTKAWSHRFLKYEVSQRGEREVLIFNKKISHLYMCGFAL